MSGRRDSRIHLADRQSDALMEFENFKRKYLLVNKHITKLNSTLSVRVEELNVQISTLYSENLRLRASEVALKAQLKKERQRSHQIILQTERAVATLMTQLSGLRNAQGPVEGTEISPPTKRKHFSSPVQPPRETVRLARAPAEIITQIRESEEDDADEDETPTRMIMSRRSSISRLPLPKHTSYYSLSPPPEEVEEMPKEIDLEAAVNRRRLGRRHSSFFIADAAPRAPSPVDGPVRRLRKRKSDERRDSLEEEEREVELQIQGDADAEVIVPASSVANDDKPSSTEDNVDIQCMPRPESIECELRSELEERSRLTKVPMEISPDPESQSAGERETSDLKEKDNKRRLVIKDVTNSPRERPSGLFEKAGVRVPSPTPEMAPSDILTPKPTIPLISSVASTPATENGSENGFEAISQNTGRERRVRKTLNYAEPKLNTKMRKPSPQPDGKSRPPGVTIRRRRSTQVVSDEDGDADVEGMTLIKNTNRRKTVHNGSATHEAHQSQAATLENNANTLHSGWNEEGRRRSLAV